MTTQIGGRLIGQGLYGCIFDPVPRCANGSVFQSVSGSSVGKVTIEDSTKELTIGRRIMKLPLAAQYFALPSNSCKPAVPITDSDAGSCKILTQETDGKKMSLLVMPSGGKEIYSWAQNLPALAANYIRLLKHLLEGMIIYQSEGYVHNDIHMGNVLVDARGVGRFIDFGLAYRLEDIQDWKDANLGVTFRPKYVWDAPELHCWRALKAGIRIPDAIRQIKSYNTEYRSMENQFPTRQAAESAMVGFFQTMARTNNGGAFVRSWGAGTDCWRLGLLFWFLWSDLIGWRELNQSPLWQQRELVRRCLGGLTEFDPRRRWSARRALAEIDGKSRLVSPPSPASPVKPITVPT